MNTKHDPTTRHMLERPMSNSGPMSPPQVRAMWAKRNNSAASASSTTPQRNFIPVPRVPIPGITPRPLPTTGTTMGESPARRTPSPPPDPMQEILDKINRLRQGLPQDPNATLPPTITVPRGGTVPAEPRIPAPTPAPPPKPRIILSGQSGNGIWAGKTPDPALKKKKKGRGTINNRAVAALHFLEQFKSS